MCGICCVITVGTDTGDVQWIDDKICESLRRRGPNHSEIVQKSLGSHNGLSCCINFSGHVLHLRGSLTPQPLQDQSGNILLWNGEIFGGINVSEGSNDGDVLLASLKKCNENEELLSVMCTVQGPWSFIYWQENKKYLWFGRDFFGRRSLLLHLPTCRNDSFVITSIACRPLTRSSK
ncbi:asparagine synthetase domain-containing protein 1-like, partial [Saccoglossus kowalevskii]|uniref:Asparagine synthetase domain-containing protein 1-like n=1 Tax=Saccoglossus kowalevskii TaxID=10224 RepID=A0ABM0MUI3_SACKO